MLIANKQLLIISGLEPNGFAGLIRDQQVAVSLGVCASTLATTLTAQNERGIFANLPCPHEVISKQLDCLTQTPTVIKIGVLPNKEISQTIARWLQSIGTIRPFLVLDPIWLNSGDHQVFANESLIKIIEPLLPFIDLLTPNLQELATLIQQDGNKDQPEKMIQVFYLQQPTFNGAMLVKGISADSDLNQMTDILFQTTPIVNTSYFRQPRRIHSMRGTGCLLSTAIASALTEKHSLASAVALASAFLARERRYRKGMAAISVALPQIGWPDNYADYPTPSLNNHALSSFPALLENSGLYPIVETSQWVAILAELGVKTIQLRIKNKPIDYIKNEIRRAIEIAQRFHLQLFINDYWQLAIELNAFGVHLGQEDIQTANLQRIKASGLRLGISTHGDYEFLQAKQLKPSYLAVGAIYETQTKDMRGKIQGVSRLKRYCKMADNIPVVAIGGINLNNIEQVLTAKPNFIAVVSAITQSDNIERSVKKLMQHLPEHHKLDSPQVPPEF